MTKNIDAHLKNMPVVAILRGVKPDEAVEIGLAIKQAGISIIEVPLNSPQPFDSISRLVKALPDDCMIGCGTLVELDDVAKLVDTGASIAVTPNTNSAIIKSCLEHGLLPVPGWATPGEAFTAYQAGARHLKLFPASTYGTEHVRAVRAVLPDDTKILAVGGVGASVAAQWLAAGVDGFGIGSDIYKAGDSAEVVAQKARTITDSIHQARCKPL